MSVVEEPIEHGGDGRGVAEQLAPVVDGTIGRDQRARLFVAAHDQLQQVFSGLDGEAQDPDLTALRAYPRARDDAISCSHAGEEKIEGTDDRSALIS